MPSDEIYLEDDPLWYKDAIIYEVHVRSFFDSNNDGIGDFKGLAAKLDYLKDLGITAIWVLPFYPSPLKDDGYDIADYFNIHPHYGTLKDFRDFLKEAHRRGIRVITELVLNHTSDQHAWFQRARRSRPGSAWRDFYVWSESADKYRDARIIFKDFETSNWAWDPALKQYYWHRFYFHQPDLNFDAPQVHKAIFKVIDFWLGMGVDGLRLDAVPYLYEREGTNCENLPETYEFLKKLRAYVDGKYRNKMLLAEANQWPEMAAAYFGEGAMCNMAFHFPLMPRIFMAVQMEDRFPIIDIMEQTPRIPENAQWALFLRNHDELTLEMVTDEERDYMYRVYAKDPRAKINLGIRRRLAPLMDNNRRKIELMNVLLFSMPGTPVIYYGDEIGMGDNYYLGDRNGVRTPMQWSPDRNAGFSEANPQQLYLPVIIDPEYHYEALNVENQNRNLSSLLWWMRRSIALRKKFKAFGRGSLKFLDTSNSKVLAYMRHWEDEFVLVVANLSRFSQVAELDLSKYAGCIPQDIFSQNVFPTVKGSPYVLTLGPYWYHMFLLRREKREAMKIRFEEKVFSEMEVRSLEQVFQARESLERILPGYLKASRWFGGKGRVITRVRIADELMAQAGGQKFLFVLVDVYYTEGLPEEYQLFLGLAPEDMVKQILDSAPQAVIARVKSKDGEGILYDGLYNEELRKSLFNLIERRKSLKGREGRLFGHPGRLFKKISSGKKLPGSSSVLRGEQTSTSLLYENIFVLKFPRKVEPGPNPDSEVVRFLTEEAGFPNVPSFAGAMEYRRPGAENIVIAMMHEFMPNEGVAWNFTIESLKSYYEGVLAKRGEAEINASRIPGILIELIGGYYLELTGLLGRRTAEMHNALLSGTGPDFAPEPFSLLYQRGLYQSMRSLVRRVFQLLNRNLKDLPENVRPEAESVLALEGEILKREQRITQKKLTPLRTRIHGDYHLGQVLYTGKDFYIIDFEGEPARALSERRLKRSPLRDAAGMLRSYQYAAYSALLQQPSIRPEDFAFLSPWADLWAGYLGGVFLDNYLKTAAEAPYIPAEKAELDLMLDTFLLDKAVYELGYELNNRPRWVIIPLKGIRGLFQAPEKEEALK
jgi:maltose alpha-D-glucosyltransferase/alpha-amylase